MTRALAGPVKIGVHVGEQETLDERHAGKSDAQRLAHHAVRAVGADHPAGVDFAMSSSRTVTPSASPAIPVTGLPQSTDPPRAVSRSRSAALDIGLRYEQAAGTAKASSAARPASSPAHGRRR